MSRQVSLKLARYARLFVAVLLVVCVVVGLGALFRAVVFVHGVKTLLEATMVWALLLLASFAGWGTALNTGLFPRDRADWGLRFAWGWGVAVAVGGYLCAFGIARRPALIGFVALGLLLLCFHLAWACRAWVKRGKVRWRFARLLVAETPFLLGVVAVLGLALVHAASVAITSHHNENDDNLLYFQFAREILERGTLTQPFAIRRIQVYGGKSVLDAMMLAIDVPETQVNVLDHGLALLTVLALLVGQVQRWRSPARSIVLLLMLFATTIPDVRTGSSTVMTGVVFFLGLYRTMDWGPVTRGRGFRPAFPIALLAAGACTLRQNYLATIAGILVIGYAALLLRSVRWSPLRVERAALLDTGAALGLLLVFLAPYWVLTYRSCGTFLFPLLKGNFDPTFALIPHLGRLEWIQYLWANINYLQPVKAVPIFLAAAISVTSDKPRRPLGALVWASFLGVFMLLFAYPLATDWEQARIYFGFTFAAILAIGLAASESVSGKRLPPRDKARVAVCVPLVIAGLSLQIYDDRAATLNTYKAFLAEFAKDSPRWAPSTQDPTYRTLQARIPAGAAIAVEVYNPYLFDHRRNPIANLDSLGGMSPPPGIPFGAGGDAVAAYFLAQGYRYLVVTRSDAPGGLLYRRDTWIPVSKRPEDARAQRSAVHWLQALDDLDALRSTRAHLAEAGNMITLDLATRSP